MYHINVVTQGGVPLKFIAATWAQAVKQADNWVSANHTITSPSGALMLTHIVY